ncbi:HAD family hydrolase [Sphingomonas jeddahensis]|uniref:Haloacid dehalogenase-like hydrolase n=1 Tax=Sphingomonas jeddahensis TaxID=1915074 RepID=A0A1V2EWP9_9SPHN|nr:HAD-IB family hydrolase [Sphingomonas jeddahensis]ONF97096.1 hypothetical protein SPHI_05330 [Sphingomonas jeddahensis]
MIDPPQASIAIYDLDRTITRLPTWTPFLVFAARRMHPARLWLLPAIGVAVARRIAGLMHRDRLKEAMHRLLLGPEVPAARLCEVSDEFADWIVSRHLRPGAVAQLAADRAEGRRIVIATAAHRFYAEPIARRLGVADLIATEANHNRAGALLPELDGPNCYGAVKQAMIAAWFASTKLDRANTHTRFYSDHVSDRPTFDWVDEPVAVNPHAKLRTLAAARGWQVVDWGR